MTRPQSSGFDGTHRIRAAVLRIDTIAERRDCSPSKGRATIRGGELPAHRLGKMRVPLAAAVRLSEIPGIGTELVRRNSSCHRNGFHVIGRDAPPTTNTRVLATPATAKLAHRSLADHPRASPSAEVDISNLSHQAVCLPDHPTIMWVIST
jgi:hypothetical protein